MLNQGSSLEMVADELAAVAVHIAQHTGRFLELLAELDQHDFHARQDFRTMAPRRSWSGSSRGCIARGPRMTARGSRPGAARSCSSTRTGCWWSGRARLSPEEGATLLKAMDAARRELDAGERPVEQTRADAFALLAERALGGAARSGGDRQMIIVHVDEEVLRSPEVAGESRLADAGGVPAESARRLACDGSVVEVRDGEVGRRTRTIGAALRRALAVRDEGRCRFPGCSCRVVDAHHVHHLGQWRGDGAGQSLVAVSLPPCAVHEGGYGVELVGDEVRFVRPDGRVVPAAPAVDPPKDELRLEAGEIARQRMTPVLRWDGARVDHGEVVASLC